MELVRKLPASLATPGIARPWVGLAASGRISDGAVDRMREITGALLEYVASRLEPQTTLELRVLPRARAARVEVRWRGEDREREGASRHEPRTGAWGTVRRLADTCGLSREHGRTCAWAEFGAASFDRRSA